jgi:hypothetical protein
MSFMPVFATATLVARAQPQLVVVTIPEDDEVHKTGIIVLDSEAPQGAPTPTDTARATWLARTTERHQDLMAQYKIMVSYNGLYVTPTTIVCQVIEKDKVNPIKDRQTAIPENLKTSLVDQTGLFACKFRWGKAGVGVVDIYYKGTVAPVFFADYIVLVSAAYTIGRSIVYGAEIQDICVLGWYLGSAESAAVITYLKSLSGQTVDNHYIFPNPLGSYVSCEDATLYQKHLVMGLPVPWS